MRTYDDYLKDLRASTTSAYEYIPKMCEALREEDKHISNEDIKERVTKDCLDAGLAKGTIINNIPEKFKDKAKVEAGKKSAAKRQEEKEIELNVDGSVAHSTGTEQTPIEPKEQDSGSSGSKEQEQKETPVWTPKGEDDVEFLKTKLNESLAYAKKLEAINKNLSEIKPETDKHDCSNHSMYLKAQAIIENERKEKEQLKQRVEEFDKITFVPASEAPNPPDLFQIPKDIDITKGQYHESLSPIQALGKIRQLLNSVTALEIGWRVIDK